MHTSASIFNMAGYIVFFACPKLNYTEKIILKLPLLKIKCVSY